MRISDVLFFLGIGFLLRGGIDFVLGKNGNQFIKDCLFIFACLLCSIVFYI